jgi:hypothetical protein
VWLIWERTGVSDVIGIFERNRWNGESHIIVADASEDLVNGWWVVADEVTIICLEVERDESTETSNCQEHTWKYPYLSVQALMTLSE